MRSSRKLLVFLTLSSVAIHAGCGGCRNSNQKSAEKRTPELTAEIIQQHNRGVALMGQFDYAAAYDVFESLAKAHPGWTAAKIDLAIATLNRREPGDRDKAMDLLRDAASQDPKHLRAYYCQGILLLDGGELDAALEMFSKVATADPLDAYAVYYTGQCLSQLARMDEALGKFRSSIELDPYFRSGYYGAFRVLVGQGKMAEANSYREQFEKLADNPQSRLAEIKYTRMGRKAEVLPIQIAAEPARKLDGPLFAGRQKLDSLSLPDGWTWNGSPSSVTSCDINGDGLIDLFLSSAARNQNRSVNVVLLNQNGMFELSADHPLSKVKDVNAPLWGDYDNDGRTDVYFCCRGPNQLWRQTAKDQWQEVTAASETDGGDVNTVNGAFVDADHDGDLDVFLANEGSNELLNNNLDGTFRSLGAEYKLAGDDVKSSQALFADLDNDRDLDIVIANQGASHNVFINDRLWSYQPADGFQKFNRSEFSAVVAADTDVDGQIELLTASGTRIQRWQPDQDGVWTATELVATEQEISNIAVADIQGDGILELVVQTSARLQIRRIVDGANLQEFPIGQSLFALASLSTDGPTLVLFDNDDQLVRYPPGSGRYPFVTLSFTGKEDTGKQMRSNRSGIGVDAAVRVGSRWTAFTTFSTQSTPGQSLQPISIGLGEARKLDFVQMTWPDGVFQTEINLGAGASHVIEETQRQVASCPVIFVWDGEKFEFFSDCLGVGGIGFNLGNGEYGTPRPWENLLLPKNLMHSKHGKFEIRIGEPMEEVCYLDAARLVMYDLPSGWSMALDERHGTGDPSPTGAPIYYKREILPNTAINDRNEDVVKEILVADFQAAPPGEFDNRFLGRTESHSVTLCFSEPLDAFDAVLLFDGWIEYPYSQTMFAAWQADASYDAPTIEAMGSDGQWKVIYQNFGYMAGMPRQSALPLPKDKLPTGTVQLRLSTNLEIYWDRLVVVERIDGSDVKRTEFELISAEVAEIGFPKRTTLAQRRPHYDYANRVPFWDTRHLTGFYTNFGPALPLVQSIDDSVAVFGPGEEIRLSFDSNSAIERDGTNHRFVLELNGWAKDKDLFTRDGDTVGPMPRRDQGSPANRNPIDKEFNQRFRTGF